MADQTPSTDYRDPNARRRASRRGFLRTAGGVAAGTAMVMAGCDGEAIPENENPTATLEVSNNNPEVGEQITFSVGFSDPDAGGGQPAFEDMVTSATLNFGNGDEADVSDGEDEPYTYEEPGMYTATLIVEDQYSGEGQDTAEVTVVVGTTMIELDFSSNIDVLNYAYALEQLEAAFYARVVTAIDDGDLSLGNDAEEAYFRDLKAHEAVHRDFLAAAIPAVADNDDALLGDLGGFLNFENAIDLGSRDQVFKVSQLLEDTGVSAYNGAGIYLADSPTLLTLAGKIVSVEARHASAVRAAYGDESDSIDLETTVDDLVMEYALTDFGANADFSLDVAQSPATVLGAVADSGLLTDEIAISATGLMDLPNTPGSPG